MHNALCVLVLVTLLVATVATVATLTALADLADLAATFTILADLTITERVHCIRRTNQ